MKKTVYFIVLTAIVHILSACSGSTVYDEYAHTPIAGWEKNDTLSSPGITNTASDFALQVPPRSWDLRSS